MPNLCDTRLGNTNQWYFNPRNDNDMLVPDEIRQCVLFLGFINTPSDDVQVFKPIGTAFIVSIPAENLEESWHVYLVTAKHVAVALEGKNFWARVNIKNGEAKFIEGDGVKWWYHPTDGSVDVAVIPWAPPEQVEHKQIPTSLFLSDEIIGEKSIGAGDLVFMTGLFTKLAGLSKNLPIVRMGNIAMMPDEKVPTRAFGDIEAYLIEARSIGGLSGSPAFVQETILGGGGKIYLLGLVHGHWDIPLESENEMEDIEGGSAINMGIAIVIPAKIILAVINQPELIEKKREAEEAAKQNSND